MRRYVFSLLFDCVARQQFEMCYFNCNKLYSTINCSHDFSKGGNKNKCTSYAKVVMLVTMSCWQCSILGSLTHDVSRGRWIPVTLSQQNLFYAIKFTESMDYLHIIIYFYSYNWNLVFQTEILCQPQFHKNFVLKCTLLTITCSSMDQLKGILVMRKDMVLILLFVYRIV